MDSINDPPLPELAPLPPWMLSPGASPEDLPALRRANEITMFEGVFERAMEHVMCGQSPALALEGDPRNIKTARFIAWMKRDAARWNTYLEAQAIGAEMDFIAIPDIADASDSIEDVARSTLRVNQRWKRMAVADRKRFGEVKQIDQTVTIDMVGAMEAARERAARRGEIVDVQPREISNG